MHMQSAKLKTRVYLLVFSLVVSVVAMAVMWLSHGGPAANAPKVMTEAERLTALEKAAPRSPAMSRFLQNERATRDANKEVTGDLPR